MSIRVWTNPAATPAQRGNVDYPDAEVYQVDSHLQLHILAAGGSKLATYGPGNWHHVEMREDA